MVADMRAMLCNRVREAAADKVKLFLIFATKYPKKTGLGRPGRYCYEPVTVFFFAMCCSKSTSFISAQASMTFGLATR